jgi:hypothetical protein
MAKNHSNKKNREKSMLSRAGTNELARSKPTEPLIRYRPLIWMNWRGWK